MRHCVLVCMWIFWQLFSGEDSNLSLVLVKKSRKLEVPATVEEEDEEDEDVPTHTDTLMHTDRPGPTDDAGHKDEVGRTNDAVHRNTNPGSRSTQPASCSTSFPVTRPHGFPPQVSVVVEVEDDFSVPSEPSIDSRIHTDPPVPPPPGDDTGRGNKQKKDLGVDLARVTKGGSSTQHRATPSSKELSSAEERSAFPPVPSAPEVEEDMAPDGSSQKSRRQTHITDYWMRWFSKRSSAQPTPRPVVETRPRDLGCASDVQSSIVHRTQPKEDIPTRRQDTQAVETQGGVVWTGQRVDAGRDSRLKDGNDHRDDLLRDSHPLTLENAFSINSVAQPSLHHVSNPSLCYSQGSASLLDEIYDDACQISHALYAMDPSKNFFDESPIVSETQKGPDRRPVQQTGYAETVGARDGEPATTRGRVAKPIQLVDCELTPGNVRTRPCTGSEGSRPASCRNLTFPPVNQAKGQLVQCMQSLIRVVKECDAEEHVLLNTFSHVDQDLVVKRRTMEHEILAVSSAIVSGAFTFQNVDRSVTVLTGNVNKDKGVLEQLNRDFGTHYTQITKADLSAATHQANARLFDFCRPAPYSGSYSTFQDVERGYSVNRYIVGVWPLHPFRRLLSTASSPATRPNCAIIFVNTYAILVTTECIASETPLVCSQAAAAHIVESLCAPYSTLR